MQSIETLTHSPPFSRSPEHVDLFVRSFRQACVHHFDHNALFQAFCRDAGFDPHGIQTEQDLERVPPILVTVFKENHLVSTALENVVLTLTSSGTSGQKSVQRLDAFSLSNVERMATNVFTALRLTSREAVNYLCFTYDPEAARDLGTAYTDRLLTGMTRVARVHYTFTWNAAQNRFVYDTHQTLEVLEQFQESGLPTRILGFPAFLHQLLRESGRCFELGSRSYVITGGGWKELESQKIAKPAFRAFTAERLGIPVENVRDLFGMVEHGIPYVDCDLGALHIPNYSRVLVRSPDTLQILPQGEVGLLHLLCSYNTSYPCISLLTTDWGRVGTCTCRLGGQTIELMGRAGISKHKGCAITAAELMGR